jgi:hypothetical protein
LKNDLVPSLARGLVVVFLALVPFRILAQGYLPGDDALRHAAKAVSGKPWSEVLVLRPEVTMDSHPGWHALLGLVHRAAGVDAPGLVAFSVALLLLALLLPGAFLLRRPEAWALALAAFATLEPRIPNRFISGRPFVLSVALLLFLCLRVAREPGPPVPDAKRRWRALLVLAVLFGLVAWMHPSWHLFLLPVAACLLARRFRLAATLAAGLGAGVLVAGVLHGNVIEFVQQSVLHTVLALGLPSPASTLAIEFLPGDGSPSLLLGLAALLLWRAGRGAWKREAVSGPVFVLAVLGWLLGFLVIRFWSDWGGPAVLAWMAVELEDALESHVPERSTGRLGLAAVAGLAAFLVWTSNTRGQRLQPAERPYQSLAAPASAPALPGPGGILYTDDMRIFFELFFARPQASWRYVVGYEPGLMRADDLATFRRVLAARTPASFEPWVRKMGPADRLVLKSTEGPPPIPGLEWTQVSQTVWSGRTTGAAAR